MGADSTIVNAAFLEARSRAEADVPDMSKLYEGQREISKTFLKGFTDMFDEMKKEEKAMKASKDAQLRAFKAQAKKSRAHLLDQEAAQPMKVHDVIYDKFKALEEEFKFYTASGDNDTPENEKMRASLYAQLQLITNQAVKSRGTIATKATLADSLVGGAVSEQDIAIGRAIMGVDGNYDNVELSFNAKGQLVYHVGLEDGSIHSWTIDDFEEKMITHDNAIDTYQATREAASYDLGNKTKQDFNGDEETSSFLKTVLKNDENIFKDIVYSEINGRKSFYDSLLEDTGIAKVAVEQLFVENVKVGLVDVNKDGVVDMLDYDPTPGDGLTQADVSSLSPDEMLLWKQNHLALVDALVNTDNPAFSFDISSELLATDFVGGLEDHFNEGRGHKEPVGRGGRGGRGEFKFTAGDVYNNDGQRAPNVDANKKREVDAAVTSRDPGFQGTWGWYVYCKSCEQLGEENIYIRYESKAAADAAKPGDPADTFSEKDVRTMEGALKPGGGGKYD